MHTQTLTGGYKSIVRGFINLLKHAYRLETLKSQIRRERDQLAQLGDHELRDIGITREQAMAESNRRFDDLPRHRLNCMR